MMGVTHASIGFSTGLVVGLVAQSTFPEAVGLGMVGSIAALLPDIDHPSSKLRQRIGVVGHWGLSWLPHRGLTHTLLFTFVVAVLSFLLVSTLIRWAIPAAYFSHLMADSLTRRGIPLWWPFSRRTFHPLPRRLRIKSGGRVEAVIATLNLALIVVLILGGQYQ